MCLNSLPEALFCNAFCNVFFQKYLQNIYWGFVTFRQANAWVNIINYAKLLFNNGPLYEVRLTHTHTHTESRRHTHRHTQSINRRHALELGNATIQPKDRNKNAFYKNFASARKNFSAFCMTASTAASTAPLTAAATSASTSAHTHTHTLTRRQRKTRDKRRLQFILMPNAEKNQTKRGRLMPLMIMREKHKKQGHTAYTWYGENRVFGGF